MCKSLLGINGVGLSLRRGAERRQHCPSPNRSWSQRAGLSDGGQECTAHGPATISSVRQGSIYAATEYVHGRHNSVFINYEKKCNSHPSKFLSHMVRDPVVSLPICSPILLSPDPKSNTRPPLLLSLPCHAQRNVEKARRITVTCT